jgi:LysR family transcriptional regulator for metE and metH
VKIDSRDLQLLLCLAEDGSLTSASKRMHLSQPAVSQRLANLQSRLGSNLFERQDGLMRPTAAGERLVTAARDILNRLETAFADIEDMRTGRARRLRITTQCYTCYRWLPYVMRDLSAQFVGLGIDVVPEATDAPLEALKQDRVDIAIVSSVEAGAGFTIHELFEDELFAVMSKDHPLAERRYLNPASFQDQVLIVYSGKRLAILDEVLHPAGVSPARVMQVRMTEAIIELARSGQGVAIQAGWAFSDLDNVDGLAAVRITRGGFKRRWRAAVANTCNDEVATAFVEGVRKIGKRIRNANWRRKLDDAETTRRRA